MSVIGNAITLGGSGGGGEYPHVTTKLFWNGYVDAYPANAWTSAQGSYGNVSVSDGKIIFNGSASTYGSQGFAITAGIDLTNYSRLWCRAKGIQQGDNRIRIVVSTRALSSSNYTSWYSSSILTSLNLANDNTEHLYVVDLNDINTTCYLGFGGQMKAEFYEFWLE